MLLNDTFAMPDDAHVECFLDHGVVSLVGDVRYSSDEAIVVALVRGVEGVVDVNSHVRTPEPDAPKPPAYWDYGAR